MDTYVLDIMRGSIHDGPGIRTTVFLKGCPLRCQWCHNPESQSFFEELSYNSGKCIACGRCFVVCPTAAHSIQNGIHTLNYDLCVHCDKCVEVCPADALIMFGKKMNPEEVFEIVVRDKIFFKHSLGGITISGGEPLSHGDFCIELLEMCHVESIHTCIETSGMGDTHVLKKLVAVTDLFLYDWKISDNANAFKYIGVETTVIQKNLSMLVQSGARVLLRCPIIPGVNDTKTHFEEIGELLNKFKLLDAELLPYHSFGVDKGLNIGKKQKKFIIPTTEQIDSWLEYFKQLGFKNASLNSIRRN